jgi:hypothetical protein
MSRRRAGAQARGETEEVPEARDPRDDRVSGPLVAISGLDTEGMREQVATSRCPVEDEPQHCRCDDSVNEALLEAELALQGMAEGVDDRCPAVELQEHQALEKLDRNGARRGMEAHESFVEKMGSMNRRCVREGMASP